MLSNFLILFTHLVLAVNCYFIWKMNYEKRGLKFNKLKSGFFSFFSGIFGILIGLYVFYIKPKIRKKPKPFLIALCGANRVGKDEIGKIMKYLILKDEGIISKNTTYQEFNPNSEDIEIKKYANPVNDLYKEFTNIDFSNMVGEAKNIERARFIDFAETMKRLFGENIWIGRTFFNYNPKKCWIITDLRFKSEYDHLLKNYNPIIIKVNNSSINEEKQANNLNEITEQMCHYTINNNGSIDNLIKNVELVLQNENLVKTEGVTFKI